MPEYEIDVVGYATYYATIVINAENAQEAESMVQEFIDSNDISWEFDDFDGHDFEINGIREML